MDEAVELAEKFRSFRAMAQLLVVQIESSRQTATTRTVPPLQAKEHELEAKAKQKQLGAYFDSYGFELPPLRMMLFLTPRNSIRTGFRLRHARLGDAIPASATRTGQDFLDQRCAARG